MRLEPKPSLRDFVEGDDLWFGWSTMLGRDFPLGISNWQVLTQWKNDGTGSPPFGLIVANGQFVLDAGNGWSGNSATPTPRHGAKWLGAAAVGVWSRWTLHVKFSERTSVGFVDAWRDGTQLVAGWHPPGGTLYPGLTSYLKVGYCRDPAIRTQGTVYHDDWRVGTSKASVL